MLAEQEYKAIMRITKRGTLPKESVLTDRYTGSMGTTY